MISKKVEKAIIHQIQLEEQSSRIYMAMASWSEVNGFPVLPNFYTTILMRNVYT